jgi:hypothetical protein
MSQQEIHIPLGDFEDGQSISRHPHRLH